MKKEEQISEHLLLAGIVTVVGVMLLLITIAMSWELWQYACVVPSHRKSRFGRFLQESVLGPADGWLFFLRGT